MLIVVSPAKTLDFTQPPDRLPATDPHFAKDAAALMRAAKRLKRSDLRQLMHISESLADLNWRRFQALPKLDPADGLQAALAFAGDVYQGLEARTLDQASLTWAQDRLRILSGLYGLLRPLDRIHPYRLEMGTAVKTSRGENLYAFWGSRIAKRLNAEAEDHADPTLVNLASQEYYGAIDQRALKLRRVTVHFREEKDGEARILAFYAKRARGMMARYAIENRCERAEDLQSFNVAGYRFRKAASTETDWQFVRPQPESKA
jgi:hypothetical protein